MRILVSQHMKNLRLWLKRQFLGFIGTITHGCPGQYVLGDARRYPVVGRSRHTENLSAKCLAQSRNGRFSNARSFPCRAIGWTLRGLYRWASRLLHRLLFSHDVSVFGRSRCIYSGCVLLCIIGWLGLAHGYGADGLRGWGTSVFFLTMAISMACLFVCWCVDCLTEGGRRLREFTLHILALSYTPVLMFGAQIVFLLADFGWSDSSLSAAVITTSFCLSCSYYYTVYSSSRMASKPENSVGLMNQPISNLALQKISKPKLDAAFSARHSTVYDVVVSSGYPET